MEPPSRGESDHLVALYFRFFESSSRILHRPTFMTEYEKYWHQPSGASIELRLKILLVLAAGSSIMQCDHAELVTLRETIFGWVYAANMWLSGPTEKDRLSITGLQIQCLVVLVRQNLNIGGDLLWDASGSLMQKAMQLSLHRDPKFLPPMPFLEAQLRRRLWATILEMVVQTSLDSALPPRITTKDYDTELPMNINDEGLLISSEGAHSRSNETFTDTWMQCILAESLPSRLGIVQYLNGTHLELDYQEILSLSSTILETLQANSRIVESIESDYFTAFHRSLLDYTIRRFLIPLHSTFAAKARSNPLFHYSLAATIDASLTLASVESDEDFQRLLRRGGGPYREGVMCASFAIGNELIAQTIARRQEGILHRRPSQRDVLKSALKELLMWASGRIQQQAETSMKSHLFLSMILAQTEAIEEDADQEIWVLKRAKDSLEHCHGLLQFQADHLTTDYAQVSDFMTATADGGMGDLDLFLGFDFSFPS
ncbi:FAD/NAD(P)-binding domain-containing protein [Paramyrothecium foliicola]|nr:FAD/NAD(P)-binding domain-containing protein [Paramyrothecium foliicola]